MNTGNASSSVTKSTSSVTPKRIIAVGVGSRVMAFFEGLTQQKDSRAKLVAMCDVNPVRLDHYNKHLVEKRNHPKVVTCHPDQLAQAVRDTRATTLLICTPDYLHTPFILQAIELGLDVIVEKPMAIDAKGCEQILKAAANDPKRVRVTFNCRYMPWAILLKRKLQEGAIGELLSMEISYQIGLRHSAEYFSRWHAEKAKSGGLMVHKATHHLDLANWWADAVPQTVMAIGRRGFFGKENAHKHNVGIVGDHRIGEDNSGDPLGPLSAGTEKTWREMYIDEASKHDGYRPDRSVWRDKGMDIEDTMSTLVQYRNGVHLTYTLHAYCPTSGCRVVLHGTHGRLEYDAFSQTFLNPDRTAISDPKYHERCQLQPLYDQPITLEIPTAQGSHGGSDPMMMDHLFGAPADDALGQMAGPQQGAASALIGIAANESIATGQAVQIADLCPSLPKSAVLSELF